ERLARAAARGVQVFDANRCGKDLPDAIRQLTHGRGTDAVIDAVGMEAHGAPLAKTAQWATGLLPDMVARRLMERAGVDRLSALHTAIDVVRRGGTVSVSGVYGGAADPMPLLTLFDKQIQLRMGQANVRRWVPEILPLLDDEDVLGVDGFATHHLPLSDGPKAYAMFQGKEDGMVKTLLRP
ncbi:glutathione-dependent formaldehyde dehydrogenase, partial [Streptomyces sp. NPDC001455]